MVNPSYFFISGFPTKTKYQILILRTLSKHNLTGVCFVHNTMTFNTSPNFSSLFLSVKHLALYRLVLFVQSLPPHMVSDLYEQPVCRVAMYHAIRRAYKVPPGQYIVMAQWILAQSVYNTHTHTHTFTCVLVCARSVENLNSYVKIKLTQPKSDGIPTDSESLKQKKKRRQFLLSQKSVMRKW